MIAKNMPWFRMYTDFLNDPKMIVLAFEDQRHFIGLLALKGDGTLDNECPPEVMNRIVAQRLWVDAGVITEVKKRLVAAGLIDDSWQPLAWEKRQMRSDADPSNAERQRRHRAKQKGKPDAENGNGEHNALRNAQVTGLEEEKEEERDTEADTEEEEKKDDAAVEQTPNVASPADRSVEIAVYLRQRGIVGSNSANPNISSWGDDIRVTNEILDAALSVVASRRMERMPGPNYLAPIVADILAARAAPATRQTSQHSKEASRAAAAASIGLGAPAYDHESTVIDGDFRRIA